MALVEAVLTYRAHALGSTVPMPIGSTDAAPVLRALRDQILAQAEEQAKMWTRIDPGYAAFHRAEHIRLQTLLAVILPDSELRPSLTVVD